MQIGRKMTELEAFEVLSVILEYPVSWKKIPSQQCILNLMQDFN